VKIALHGATGRMGGAVLSAARAQGHEIVGAIAEPGCVDVGRDVGEVQHVAPCGVAVQEDIASALLGAEVVIDFSQARAVTAVARAAARAGIALVSGTTGLDPGAERALDQAAAVVPVVWAPNFSIGIQVLTEVLRHAMRRLGQGFAVEVVEVHHGGKADAPSGTARRLAQEAASARDRAQIVFGREGLIGARPAHEIGVLSVRGGDVVGDHTVYLLGQGERLELTHRATNREVFAQGALFAAQAVLTRTKGRYTLADLLP
jgi:4-hydroxy-tetrahydrodipicolinate reductase